MRIRTKYQLKAPEGVEIQYRDHETALLAAGKKAIPDKAVTVCEDHLLVDELSGNEVRAFGRVVAKTAGLKLPIVQSMAYPRLIMTSMADSPSFLEKEQQFITGHRWWRRAPFCALCLSLALRKEGIYETILSGIC